jgi:hypothetical protein
MLTILLEYTLPTTAQFNVERIVPDTLREFGEGSTYIKVKGFMPNVDDSYHSP